MPSRSARWWATVTVVAVLASGCGDEGRGDDAGPTVVVTTSILGDVVEELTGGLVAVEVVMPRRADPHDFQASARQVDLIGSADALVVNGAGFEEGLLDVVESAEVDGVPTLRAAESIDGADPHFFTDPVAMIEAAGEIVRFLGDEVDGLDPGLLETTAQAYLDELASLDDEVESILSVVAAGQRVLVTTHDVFGPFAARYGFEVLGTVVEGSTTAASPSAGSLEALIEVIREAGGPAVFVDSSSSDELARTVADEVGDVDVVELFTESLGEEGGPGGTYVSMIRTDAERIATALA